VYVNSLISVVCRCSMITASTGNMAKEVFNVFIVRFFKYRFRHRYRFKSTGIGKNPNDTHPYFQRYESGTQELIGPSCEMTASKLKYFNSGRKWCRWKRVGHIASPQTRRPGKHCVYRSHTRLYFDFSWDSVAQKNCFAFGVNAPSESAGRRLPVIVTVQMFLPTILQVYMKK